MAPRPTAQLAAVLAASTLAAACGSGSGASAPRAALSVPAAPGGSVALDGALLVAYVADADNRALHRIDLTTGRVVTTPFEAAPEQVARVDLGDGVERVVATLRDADRVVVCAMDAEGVAHVEAEATVAGEPWGVAVSSGGDVLVTSATGAALTALALPDLAVRVSAALAREPRAVVPSADGRRAFVTHVVGDAVSVVDLDGGPSPHVRRSPVLGGRVRDRADRAIGAGTLHPSASLAYAAALSPDGVRLFVPHLASQSGSDTKRSIPGAYGGVPIEEETTVASVAVVAAATERLVGDAAPAPGLDGAVLLAVDPAADFAVAPPGAPTRQARGVAVVGDAVLVASQGTDQLCELDGRALDPAMALVRCFDVGGGPTGVAADAVTRVAVTFDQLDHAISVVDLDSGTVERIEVARDPLSPEVAAGRRLFLTERDRRISRDGRACAACHPEGRDDGLVWKLGVGPRQTPTLVGRVGRGPFGWLAKHATLEGNMAETMSRLGGTGLPERELGQLAAFVRRGLTSPPRRAPVDEARAARGRALFSSPAVGCAGCHDLATEGSDRTLHAVGSRSKTDSGDAFRTPPLAFVGTTAPYFHDGRYATLEALVDDNLDRMGQTTHLTPSERGDLIAFLRSL